MPPQNSASFDVVFNHHSVLRCVCNICIFLYSKNKPNNCERETEKEEKKRKKGDEIERKRKILSRDEKR